MTNLDTWNRFADIDPSFTKPITGKSYKGTSPNPQYVIRCLTELFGPVGQGFGWEVIADDFTPLGDEVLHWCRIRFWHTDKANSYDSYGQTKALMKTKNGMMLDEDAPKKSLTDAIIKAASQLGIAANIFLGRWDDQKYVQEVDQVYREAEQPKPSSASMKKQLEEIDRELLDCHSILAVDTCAKTWAHIMKRDNWPKDFIECAKPKFQQRRDAINAQDTSEEPEHQIAKQMGGRIVNERITDVSGRELHNHEAA